MCGDFISSSAQGRRSGLLSGEVTWLGGDWTQLPMERLFFQTLENDPAAGLYNLQHFVPDHVYDPELLSLIACG